MEDVEYDENIPPPPSLIQRSASYIAQSLLNEGIPVYMARRAALLVGNDENDQRAFVLANADQPDEFWNDMSSQVENPSSIYEQKSELEVSKKAVNKWKETMKKRKRERSEVENSLAVHSNEWSQFLCVQPNFDVLSQIKQNHQKKEHSFSDWIKEILIGDFVDLNLIHCPQLLNHEMVPFLDAKPPCSNCNMLGPSEQTGYNYCKYCMKCETCTNTSISCVSSSRRSDHVVEGNNVTLWSQCQVTKAGLVKFQMTLPSSSASPLYFKFSKLSGFGETIFYIRQFEDNDGTIYVPGMEVTFAMSSGQAEFANCPGTKLSFTRGTTFVIHSVSGAFFKTTSYTNLWAPLSALVGFVPIAQTLSSAEVKVIGEGYSTSCPLAISGFVNASGNELTLTFTKTQQTTRAAELNATVTLSMNPKMNSSSTSCSSSPSLSTSPSTKEDDMEVDVKPNQFDVNAKNGCDIRAVTSDGSHVECSLLDSTEIESFHSVEHVWRELTLSFTTPINLKKVQLEFENIRTGNKEKISRFSTDDEVDESSNPVEDLSIIDVVVPCWSNDYIRKPTLHQTNIKFKHQNKKIKNKMNKFHEIKTIQEDDEDDDGQMIQKNIGFSYTDLVNRIGCYVAVNVWAQSSLRIENRGDSSTESSLPPFILPLLRVTYGSSRQHLEKTHHHLQLQLSEEDISLLKKLESSQRENDSVPSDSAPPPPPPASSDTKKTSRPTLRASSTFHSMGIRASTPAPSPTPFSEPSSRPLHASSSSSSGPPATALVTKPQTNENPTESETLAAEAIKQAAAIVEEAMKKNKDVQSKDGTEDAMPQKPWLRLHGLLDAHAKDLLAPPSPPSSSSSSISNSASELKMVQRSRLVVKTYQPSELLSTSIESVRSQYVVGTVVASNQWMDADSSIIAIAIPPSDPLNDYDPIMMDEPVLKTDPSVIDVANHYGIEFEGSDELARRINGSYSSSYHPPRVPNIAFGDNFAMDPDPIFTASRRRLVDWSCLLVFDPLSTKPLSFSRFPREDDDEEGEEHCFWYAMKKWLDETLAPIIKVQELKIHARQIKYAEAKDQELSNVNKLREQEHQKREKALADVLEATNKVKMNEVVICNDDEWSCVACTFRNNVSDNVCGVCETVRPTEEERQRIASEQKEAEEVKAAKVVTLPSKQIDLQYFLCVSPQPLTAIAISDVAPNGSPAVYGSGPPSSFPMFSSPPPFPAPGGFGGGSVTKSLPKTMKEKDGEDASNIKKLAISRGDIVQAQLLEDKWLRITSTPFIPSQMTSEVISRPYYFPLKDNSGEPLFKEQFNTTFSNGAAVRIRPMSLEKAQKIGKDFQVEVSHDKTKRLGETGIVVSMNKSGFAMTLRVRYDNDGVSPPEEDWLLPFVTLIDSQEVKESLFQSSLTKLDYCMINDVINQEDVDAQLNKDEQTDRSIRDAGCALLLDVPKSISSCVLRVLNNIANDQEEPLTSSSSDSWSSMFEQAVIEASLNWSPPPCSFKLIPMAAALSSSSSTSSPFTVPPVSVVRSIVAGRGDMVMPGPVRAMEYPATACPCLVKPLADQANSVLSPEHKVFGTITTPSSSSSLSSSAQSQSSAVPVTGKSIGDTGIVLALGDFTTRSMKTEIVHTLVEEAPESLVGNMITMDRQERTSREPAGFGDGHVESWKLGSSEGGSILARLNDNSFVIDRENLDAFSSRSTPFSNLTHIEKVRPAIIWDPSSQSSYSSSSPSSLSLSSSSLSSSSSSSRAQDRDIERGNRRANQRAANRANSEAQPRNGGRGGGRDRARGRGLPIEAPPRIRPTSRPSSTRGVALPMETCTTIELLDTQPFTLSWFGGARGQGLPHIKNIASDVSQHFAECIVCFELKVFGMFPNFCYKNFRVSGDGMVKEGPRHPRKICNICFEHHVSSSMLNTGKLFVRCPYFKCNRSLQTLELQDVVPKKDYDIFVLRLKEAEEFAQQSMANEENEEDADEVSLATLSGLELRMCPTCSIRIEKNEGCSSMICYRCGANFTWSSAKLVKAATRKKSSKNSKVEKAPPLPMGSGVVTPSQRSGLLPGTFLVFVRTSSHPYEPECTDGNVTVLSVRGITPHVRVGWLNSTHSAYVRFEDLRWREHDSASTSSPSTMTSSSVLETNQLEANITPSVSVADSDLPDITISQNETPTELATTAEEESLEASTNMEVDAQPAVEEEAKDDVQEPEPVTLRSMLSDPNPVRGLDKYLIAVEESYQGIKLSDIEIAPLPPSMSPSSNPPPEASSSSSLSSSSSSSSSASEPSALMEDGMEEAKLNDRTTEKKETIVSTVNYPKLEFATSCHKALETIGSEAPMSLATYLVFEDLIQDLFSRIVECATSLNSQPVLKIPANKKSDTSTRMEVDGTDQSEPSATNEILDVNASVEIVAQISIPGEFEDVQWYLCWDGLENVKWEMKQTICDYGCMDKLDRWLSESFETRMLKSTQFMDHLCAYQLIPWETYTVGAAYSANFSNLITSRSISTAVKLVFPGELGKFAVEAGEAALALFLGKEDENPGSLSSMSAPTADDVQEEETKEDKEDTIKIVLNDFKSCTNAFGSTTTWVRPVEEAEEEEEEEGVGRKVEGMVETLGALTSLVFPVAHVGDKLAQRLKGFASIGSAVFLAAVLDYITLEWCEFCAKACNDCGDRVITPHHFFLVASHDAELDTLVRGTCILGGGSRPVIHQSLLNGVGMFGFNGGGDEGTFLANNSIANFAGVNSGTLNVGQPNQNQVHQDRPGYQLETPDYALPPRNLTLGSGGLGSGSGGALPFNFMVPTPPTIMGDAVFDGGGSAVNAPVEPSDNRRFLTDTDVFATISRCFEHEVESPISGVGEVTDSTTTEDVTASMPATEGEVTALTPTEDVTASTPATGGEVTTSTTTEDETASTPATEGEVTASTPTDNVTTSTSATEGGVIVQEAAAPATDGAPSTLVTPEFCFLGGEACCCESKMNKLARMPEKTNSEQLRDLTNLLFSEMTMRAVAARAGALKLSASATVEIRGVALLWLDHIVRNTVRVCTDRGGLELEVSDLLSGLKHVNSLSLSATTVWGTGRLGKPSSKWAPQTTSLSSSSPSSVVEEEDLVETRNREHEAPLVDEADTPLLKRTRVADNCEDKGDETSRQDEVEEEDQESDVRREKKYRIVASNNGKKVAVVKRTWAEFIQAEEFDEKFYIEDLLAEQPEEWKQHELAESILLPLLLLSRASKESSVSCSSSSTDSSTTSNRASSKFIYKESYGVLTNPANVHTASVDMVKLAQDKTGPLLPFLPLARLVAQIAHDYSPAPVITPPLVHVLGEVLEKHLISMLKSAQVGSFHAKRFGVQAADFSIVRSLRGERSAQSYQQQPAPAVSEQPPQQPQQQTEQQAEDQDDDDVELVHNRARARFGTTIGTEAPAISRF